MEIGDFLSGEKFQIRIQRSLRAVTRRISAERRAESAAERRRYEEENRRAFEFATIYATTDEAANIRDAAPTVLGETEEVRIREVLGLTLVAQSGESDSQVRTRQQRLLRSISEGYHIVECVGIVDEVYEVRFMNPLPGLITAEDTFLWSDGDYAPIESEIHRIAENELGPAPPETTITGSSLEDTQRFLSVEQNPIFKSFESVKGKGLAGFITSLNFDWINETTVWETNGLNNRAPKLCKVNVHFAPIHDIAPGIDSNGFNRAPIYSVGNLGAASTFDLPNVEEDNDDYRSRISSIKMFRGT